MHVNGLSNIISTLNSVDVGEKFPCSQPVAPRTFDAFQNNMQNISEFHSVGENSEFVGINKCVIAPFFTKWAISSMTKYPLQ